MSYPASGSYCGTLAVGVPGAGIVMATQPRVDTPNGPVVGYYNAKWCATMNVEYVNTKYTYRGIARTDALATQNWQYPAGDYNKFTGVAGPGTATTTGFLQGWYYQGQNYPTGREGNFPVYINLPSDENSNMDCCDLIKRDSISTNSQGFQPFADIFLPGWERTATGFHNGKFEVYNGTFGSEAGTSFPPGLNRSTEIVYSIPRMYQVSMYQFMPSVDFNQFGGATTADLSNGFITPSPNFVEYIFGLNPWVGNKYGIFIDNVASPPSGVPGGSNNRFTNRSISTITSPMAYVSGETLQSGLSGYNNGANSCYGTANPCLPFNQLPTSPIYWDHENGGRVGSQGAAQLIFNSGGEATVGQRYNQNSHYWSDIEALTQRIFDVWAPYEGWANISDMPHFQLQNGSNTFYDTWQGTWAWPTNASPSLNWVGTIGKGGPGWNTSSGGPPADWNFWTTNPTTDKGFVGYMGALDNNGVGDPDNKRYRFNPFQLPGTFAASGYSQPVQGGIVGGDPEFAPTTWDIFQNSISDWLTGNGLPGGRYVVTLRATDRSAAPAGLSNNPAPNPAGQYTEWDIPVVVMPWRTPVYGMGMCAAVNSGGWQSPAEQSLWCNSSALCT